MKTTQTHTIFFDFDKSEVEEHQLQINQNLHDIILTHWADTHTINQLSTTKVNISYKMPWYSSNKKV